MLQRLNKVGDAWQLEAADSTPWQTPEKWTAGQALLLGVDAEPLAAWSAAACIGIEFPAFNDGRGLSLAVLLRTRIGFQGDLRATGNIHEDVLHYMIRCGFTSFDLPPERDAQTALASLRPYSAFYQGSASAPEPAFPPAD